MEFKRQLIKDLLRILTPEEISELTTSYGGKKKVSLSLLTEADLVGNSFEKVMEKAQDEEISETEGDEGKAKILPFDGVHQELEESFSAQVGPRVIKLMAEYDKAFKKMDQTVLGPKRFAKRKGNGQKQQTSTLILEQKKKLFKSYSKIKSMEVLTLYKTTGSVTIELDKSKREENAYSDSKGVLVNKKQA